ncbi:conserved hypothetical protein [Hyella patelloides LEGE 07179]|uniref:Uncharacterized protein n=1 Tax=Hyella patelloides LEGE 07179 TaxID=945734 RepID=A0A563VUE9_9CYAN|nr:hypothetical protein [Hyella patelloides]VEP15025.1 conserved hypothetical protein [Hyella patelloides LEGE 07179]
MIVSYLSRSLGMLFFMACFGALMNPPPYILIGIVFFIMGLVLLPSTNKITKQTFNWEIKGGTKATVLLVGFLLVCLVVPQVNLKTTSFSINYLEHKESI